MRKKQTAVGVEDDWEVARDVVVRKPLGVVLSVRLTPSQIDPIARAAESLGLTTLEFTRQAALIVANDPLLCHRLAQAGAPGQKSTISVDRTSDPSCG